MTKIFLSLFGLYLNFSHSFVIALHPAAAVDGVLMRPAYKKFIRLVPFLPLNALTLQYALRYGIVYIAPTDNMAMGCKCY